MIIYFIILLYDWLVIKFESWISCKPIYTIAIPVCTCQTRVTYTFLVKKKIHCSKFYILYLCLFLIIKQTIKCIQY